MVRGSWYESESVRGASCVVTGFALTTLLSSRVARIPLVTDHAGSWVPPVTERKMLPAPMRSTLPLGRFFPESLSRWLSNTIPARVALWCGPFNRVAAELGVESVPSFAALLLGDLTLVTDCPEVLGISKAELEAWRPDPRRYRPATRLRRQTCRLRSLQSLRRRSLRRRSLRHGRCPRTRPTTFPSWSTCRGSS